MAKYKKLRKTNRKNPARPSTMFKPGHPKYGGRKKGTPNKFNGELKQLVLNALANAHRDGAQAWLQQQARQNAKTFMSALLAKLLPTQVTGKDGGPIGLLVDQAAVKLASLDEKELAVLETLLKKAGLVGLSIGTAIAQEGQ